MKAEYKEGPEASENFERLATAVFQAPKKEPKKQPKKAAKRPSHPAVTRARTFPLARPCRLVVERVNDLAR
jgi:hypothetical protein